MTIARDIKGRVLNEETLYDRINVRVNRRRMGGWENYGVGVAKIANGDTIKVEIAGLRESVMNSEVEGSSLRVLDKRCRVDVIFMKLAFNTLQVNVKGD